MELNHLAIGPNEVKVSQEFYKTFFRRDYG